MRSIRFDLVPRRRLAAARGAALAMMLLIAAPTFADVTVQRKTVSSGLAGFGDATTTETMVIAGDRSRADQVYTYTGRLKMFAGGGKPRPSAHIIRIDRELVWDLDPGKKTYTELTFDQMRELAAKGAAAAEQEAEKPENQQAARDVEMKFSVDVQRTGKKETVNGFPAEQVIVALKAEPKSTKSDEKSPPAGAFVMKMDQWLSNDVPGQAEVLAYYRRMAEKLGLDPEIQRMGSVAMAQYGNAMRELAAKMKDLKGYPVRSTLTIESDSTLSAQRQADMNKARTETAKAQAEGKEAEKKAERQEDVATGVEVAGGVKKGNVGGAIGGFLGRKLAKAAAKKAEEKAEAAASSDTAGVAGPVFKTVTDVLSVSTAPAAGVSFDVPSGYKRIERKEK